jgi:hypothetical protein
LSGQLNSKKDNPSIRIWKIDPQSVEEFKKRKENPPTRAVKEVPPQKTAEPQKKKTEEAGLSILRLKDEGLLSSKEAIDLFRKLLETTPPKKA